MQRANEADLAYRGGDSGVKYMIRGPLLDWGVILLKPGRAWAATTTARWRRRSTSSRGAAPLS